MTFKTKQNFAWAGLLVAIVWVMGLLPVLAADQTTPVRYRPGLGKSVGVVQRVRGEVVIGHDGLESIKAERGTRLFKGDIIQTLDNSRVRVRLSDGSLLSLAANTELKLTRSVYQKQKKQRSSFFQMALGKARFFVVKLLDYKRSEFKVKTPTAVCGVRGSDFILSATATETIATALEDTELEFQSLAFLEEPPVILRDYEESITILNQRPTPPERLPLDRIREKRDQFMDVTPDKGSISDEDADEGVEQPDDTGVDEVGDLGDQISLEEYGQFDFGDERDFSDYETGIQTWTPGEIDAIKETITEVIVGSDTELPEFPETP